MAEPISPGTAFNHKNACDIENVDGFVGARFSKEWLDCQLGLNQCILENP